MSRKQNKRHNHNVKGASPMTKQYSFTKKKPNLPLTIVGFGQGGGNIANEFARLRMTDGQKSYDAIAVNSNQSDLTTLTNIKDDNRIWLGKDDNGKEFKGFGKSAELGTTKLRNDSNAKKVMSQLINERLGNEEVQNVVFVACEGGGTGTSMLNEAVEEFKRVYRDPIPGQARDRMIALRNSLIEAYGEVEGVEAFNAQANDLSRKMQEYINDELAKKRLSIIITLPSRNDGGQVLRQVSQYTAELWRMAQDDTYGIGHVIIVDNQHLEDEYQQLSEKTVDVFTYINQKVANIVHELNVGSKIGDTNKVLDGQDFEMLLYGGKGALFLTKFEKPVNEVQSDSDITDMFTSTFKREYLHGAMNYAEKDAEKNITNAKLIHNVMLFAVVPDKNKYNGVQFLANSSRALQKELITSEFTNVYSGYIEDQSVQTVTVYVAYKIEGLPERLEKGLYEEYKEYQEQRKDIEFQQSNVNVIESSNTKTAFGSFEDILFGTNKPTEQAAATTTFSTGGSANDLFKDLEKQPSEKEKKQKAARSFIDNFKF